MKLAAFFGNPASAVVWLIASEPAVWLGRRVQPARVLPARRKPSLLDDGQQ